ncbi:pleckstrin homology domain-containing family G member 5 isoform X2 [Anabrus simplex]|uniref:pleckstrin homology domain-containing family G member 5 isoform X2 n=1 Tax=Anabrus simplex TaxID=316456 RepID=UPI0035A273EB
MTLTSQLGGNSKMNTPLMRRKRKDSTASLKEDARTKKKEKETSSTSSNTERKPVQRKPSFIKRALADLGFNKVLSRSISLSSDLDRIDSIKKTPWTASLSSLKEDVITGEDDNVILDHDLTSERGATCGVKRTQSLLLGGSKRDERLRKIQERGLQSIPRQRAASHGGPSSPGFLGHFDPPESPTLTTQTPATSLPCLLKFPVVEEHATSEPPRYRRQSSSEANRRNSKLRRQEAFKNDRGAISGRSRSLTHIDALDTGSMLVKNQDMDSRSEPDTTHDRLIVPVAEPPHVRRQKLARSQVSSSEYFSVSFEFGDDSGPDEFVPATKGIFLFEALTSLCQRRGIDINNISVYQDSSKQPLQIHTTDTAWMGGKHVRVKPRDDKSPVRGVNKVSNSQVPLRKAAGSYRNKGGRFFSASTEDPSYICESSHEGSFKGSKTSKQRWSGLFGNNKDTKMESLVEHLNSYTKHGIPKQAHPDMAREEMDESLFNLEEDWQDIVAHPDELPERQRHQQTAIWELVQTEVAYIRTLKVVTDLFLSCLCSLQAANILNEIDTSRLFSNITDIYRANCLFWTLYVLPMIQTSRDSARPLDPSMMLEGFRKFDEVFHPYRKYCGEQLQCQLYCREKHQENEMFTAYLAWCETQKDCNRLRLMDILVKPMQRLTKYSLLLKAVHKNTQHEEQRASLERMIKSVDEFVHNVNTTMRQREDHERLRGIIARIESYDVVESKDDELERLLRSYSELDLTSPMPGCHVSQRRYLLLESDLKFRDNLTSKMDVHCFLLTDMLLVCKPTTKRSGSDGRMRVVRQPFVVERLMVHELGRDPPGLGVVYLNEYRTATAAFILSSAEPSLIKNWADGIRKAQDLYAAAKLASMTASATNTQSVTRQPSTLYYDEDHLDDTVDELDCQSCASLSMGVVSRSPRGGSSRGSRVSSLAHSHSGSMDMNEVSSMSSISHSRGVSMENELRGSSLSSDEGIPALVPSTDSVNKPPPPAPSPRPERRSLLSKSPTPNTLSVQVPVYSSLGQSLPNLSLATSPGSHIGTPNPPTSLLLVPPSGNKNPHHHHGGLLSPGHRGISYPPPSPPRGSLRRGVALSQSRNPPLIKTRHINSSCCSGTNMISPTQGTGVAPPAGTTTSFDFDVPVIAGVSPPSDERVSLDPPESNTRSHRYPVMKRLTRTDNRRYHTAGAIDDIKKQNSRDTSIHKRLSWNCGQGQCQAGVEPASKCISTDSVHSSSGVSSTSSAQFGSMASELEEIGSLEVEGSSLQVVCENPLGCCYDLPSSHHTFSTRTPSMEAINMELLKSQLSPAPSDPGGSTQPNISSIQEGVVYTQNERATTPSKEDLLRMKDLILTDSSLEASNV